MARASPMTDPIVWAETNYQRRSRLLPRGWRLWLQRGLYVVMLQLALAVYLAELAASLLRLDTRPLHAALGPVILLLAIFAISMHLLLLLRTLAAAANSVSRERTNGAWDLLLLTNVDGWRLVGGKWRATLRAHARDWLMLVPIRVGLVTFAGAYLTARTAQFMSTSAPGYQMAPPSPLALLLLVPLLLIFTLGGAAIAAAAGILAGLLVRRSSLALAVGAGVLVALAVAAGLVGFAIQRLLYSVWPLGDSAVYERFVIASSVTGTVTATFVDNATTMLMLLAHYRALPMSVEPTDPLWLFGVSAQGPDVVAIFWLSLFISLALYALALRVLLRLARAASFYIGALPAEA